MTTPIDLHDIAALLAYEQATADPRFASVRLHEVSSSPDGSISFESARIKSEVLAADKRGVPATAWLFRKDEEAPTPTPKDHLARDPHASAAALKEDIDAQELVYHQSRSHDGCYKVRTPLASRA